MKDGWQQKKLADVILDIKDGGTPSRKNLEYFGGDIYWCVVKDIKPLIFDTAEKLTQAGLNNCSAKVWPVGSVIISLGATIGQIGIAKVPTATKQGLAGIVVNRKLMTPEFLAYGLLNQKEYIQSLATGTTIKEVRPSRFAELLQLPIPSLTEQSCLVTILDEAFEGISTAKANAEKNLRNARELYECRLESLFESGDLKWPEHPLEQVATIINGYAFKSTDFQADPGIRSIKITNVGVRDFVEDAGNYLPAAFAQRHSGVTVTKGSIVLALTRTIIAGGLKVAVVPRDFDGALLNQRVAAIQPHAAELEAPFLFAYLSSRRVMNYVKARVNTLMQPNLSIADLRSLPIPLPALSAQRELAASLDQFDEDSQRLESLYFRRLASLDELKKSLLHLAFAGALTARCAEEQVAEVT